MANNTPVLAASFASVTGVFTTTRAFTVGAAIPVGDTALLAVYSVITFPTTLTITDTRGNVWTQDIAFPSIGSLMQGFYRSVVTTAIQVGDTITLTASSPNTISDVVGGLFDVPGLLLLSALDRTATANIGTGTTAASVGPTAVTTQTAELAFAMFTTYDTTQNSTVTPTAPYTGLGNIGGNRAGVFLVLGCQYLQLVATGAQTAAGTFSVLPDGASAGIIATYKVAPRPPTALDCTPGGGQVKVSFIAPADNGGSALTSYTVKASPGGATGVTPDGSTLSATVTGLTNGTTYTFTAHATNANGNSTESVASKVATPYASVGGQSGGGGFSGSFWSGANAAMPSGFIWGFPYVSGGHSDRLQKLGGYQPSLTAHDPNPPITLLTFTVPVSNTNVVLLEAPGTLYQTCIVLLEAPGQFLSTGLVPLEAPGRLSQTRAAVLEAQINTRQTRTVLLEAPGKLYQTGLSYLEARGIIAGSGVTRLESVIPLLRAALVGVEQQLHAVQAPTADLEALGRPIGSGVTRLEAVKQLLISGGVRLESTLALLRTALVDLENTFILRQTAASRLEALAHGLGSGVTRLEILSGLAPLARLLLEAAGFATAPVSGTALLPLESGGGVTRSVLQQLEAYARISAATAVIAEALHMQTALGLVSAEAASAATYGALIALEASGRHALISQALIALEAHGIAGQLLSIDLESGAIYWTPFPPVTQAARVLIEALNYARRARTIPVEQTPVLFDIAQALGFGIENRGTPDHFLHGGGENILIIREHG